jgi:two-component system response regulator RpaA
MPTALVVDDSADLRFLFATMLRTIGFATVEAASGEEALATASAMQPLPDVVLLDVQMPVVDGWGTLAGLRDESRTAEVPIVMCTVKASPADRVRAWELGCDAYVVKPFDIHDLLWQIREVVRRSPAERLALREERLADAREELGTFEEAGWRYAP